MINLVVIGVGQRGLGYIKYLINNVRTEIISTKLNISGIFDKNKLFTTHAHSKYNSLKVYDSILHIMSDESVNGVIISTIDRYHITVLKKILSLCKTRRFLIIMEKPISDLDAELYYINNLELPKHVTLHFPLILRYTKCYQKLKQLLDKDDITSIVLRSKLSVSHSISYIRRRKTHNILKNKLCHDLDVVSFLSGGKIQKVHIETKYMSINPQPYANRKSNCRNCDVDSCIYRFNHKKSYTVVRDIEDVNDECVIDLSPMVEEYVITATMDNDIECYIYLSLMSDTDNRLLMITTDKHHFKCNYASQQIHVDDILKYENDEPYNVGHKNGDLYFLKHVENNYNNNTHTLLQESIDYFNLLVE